MAIYLGRPLPGSWPPYGYIWVDDKKTQLDFDPGQSQQVMRRIWHYFIHGDHPTLAGMAKILNREGVTTPREYRGIIRAANAVKPGPRWTAETIRTMLHTPVYWRGDAEDKVPAYRWSMRYQRRSRAAARQGLTVPEDVVMIPAYGPAYVSKEDAARIHARFAANQQYSYRNQRYVRDTLLHHGLLRCGYCGWALSPYTYKRPRADGSRMTLYRCLHANITGTHADCKGVTINAETLDFAVLEALDQQVNEGDFLERIFRAWDADAESAMGNVRSIEATLSDNQEMIANLAARIARYRIDDPAAAPLEAHLRQLQETIPGLQQRRAKALAAVDTARANPALRAELAKWFDAWLGGVWMMSRDMQREFLMSLRAEVTLWRAEDRTPRAQLVIKLPTSAALLPLPAQTDSNGEGLHLDIDTTTAEQLVKAARGWKPVASISSASGTEPTTTTAPAASVTNPDDAEAMMAKIVAELTARGFGDEVATRIAPYFATSRPTLPKKEEAAAR